MDSLAVLFGKSPHGQSGHCPNGDGNTCYSFYTLHDEPLIDIDVRFHCRWNRIQYVLQKKLNNDKYKLSKVDKREKFTGPVSRVGAADILNNNMVVYTGFPGPKTCRRQPTKGKKDKPTSNKTAEKTFKSQKRMRRSERDPKQRRRDLLTVCLPKWKNFP